MKLLAQIGLCVALTTPCGAQPRPAGKTAEVDRVADLSTRAKAAYDAKDYATAVDLYREAWRIEPVAGVLYNIAFIYDEHLGDRALAADYYRRYVNAPDAEADARLRAFERLAAFRAADKLAAERAAAEKAAADRAAAERAAAEKAAAEKAAAAKAATGRVPIEPSGRTIDGPTATAGGPADDTGRPGTRAMVEPAPESNGSAGPTILMAAGGVAVVTGAILGVIASETHEDFVAARDDAEREGLASDGRAQALGADIAVGVGVASLGAGLLWWLLADDDATGVTIAPSTVDGRAGLVFGHAF